MSTDIQERLASIKARITKASQEEARNDVLRERATAEYTEAMNQLKAEFDVNSLEAAQALRRLLEDQLIEEVASTEKALDALDA